MRKNFGLCEFNFKEPPYCNQMSAAFNKKHRFCHVCGKYWKFNDGMIVETTRREYKLSDLTPGSQWFFDSSLSEIIEVGDSKEEGDDWVSVRFKTNDGSESVHFLRHLKTSIMPFVRYLTEQDEKDLEDL